MTDEEVWMRVYITALGFGKTEEFAAAIADRSLGLFIDRFRQPIIPIPTPPTSNDPSSLTTASP
jgi:hypothetical protein